VGKEILELSVITQNHLSKGSNLKYRTFYLRIFRGSGLKAGGTAIIGVGPPIGGPDSIFLPEASNEDGPPCSLNICIATSGGAGTKGPNGL
jgi:hypothetical protein